MLGAGKEVPGLYLLAAYDIYDKLSNVHFIFNKGISKFKTIRFILWNLLWEIIWFTKQEDWTKNKIRQ